MERKKKISELLPAICVSLAFGFLLFIYAPLELYSVNKNEMWFDAAQMLPFMLVFFCVVSCASVIGLWIAGKVSAVLYRIVLAAYFVGYLCTYVQGNFLVGKLPPLDGSWIDWDLYTAGRVESICLWIAVIVIVAVLFRWLKWQRFAMMVQYVSVCMILMLSVTLFSLCLTNRTFEKKLNYSVTTDGQFEMSQGQNFIVLLLDAYDGPAFTGLLEQYPEYGEMLQDFTYYPDTISAYPYTQYSVPFILSGDWYECDEPLQEYLDGVYRDSGLFAELEKRNYGMGIYDVEIGSQDESIFRFDNVYETELYINSFWEFAKQEMKLIGFKYGPFDLKRFCVIKQTGYDVLRGMKEDYAFFTGENIHFYEQLQAEPVTYADGYNCFKFIHLEGPHVPYRYDKDMNVIDSDYGTYEQNMQASLTLTKAYLEKLKESGVYDNSVIVIMADHGFELNNESEGRQCPLFLVKGVNEKHDFAISEVPVSHADLQEAFLGLMDGQSSAQVFEAAEDTPAERRYLFHTYEEDEQLIEYIQKGKAWDLETLEPTGREYLLK